jgi:hypothetical protein
MQLINDMVQSDPVTWDSSLKYIINIYRMSLQTSVVKRPSQADVDNHINSTRIQKESPPNQTPYHTPSAPARNPTEPPQSSTPNRNAPARQDPGISPVPSDPKKHVHFESDTLGTASQNSSLYCTAESPNLPAPNLPAPDLPAGHAPPQGMTDTSLGSMHRNDLLMTQSLMQQQLAHMSALTTVIEKSHTNDNFRVKPDTFDGEKSWEWNDYLGHFEEVARCNNWNEKKKAAILASSLRGCAIQAWRDKFPGTPASASYDLLVATLTERFNPAGMEYTYKNQFHNARKKPDQSLEKWAHYLRHIASKAYPDQDSKSREDMIKDHFLRTLEDNQMKKAVAMAHPESLDKALCLAMEYDTLDDKVKQLPKKPVAPVLNPSQRDSALTDQINDLSTQLTKLRSQMPDRMSQPLKRDTKLCWTCNQPGHFKYNCPNKHLISQPVKGNLKPTVAFTLPTTGSTAAVPLIPTNSGDGNLLN